LKEYKSKLILFPRGGKKPRKEDSDADTRKMASQLKGPLMPIRQSSRAIEFRTITEEERKGSVFEALRKGRADSRLVGVREKRAKQKAEQEKQEKKPPAK
jgi:large subunit ribosomal protein L13e